MIREGRIEKIIFQAENGTYTVLSVSSEDGEEVFVGDLYGAGEGLYIIAEGEYVNHPKYEVQFKFTSCEVKLPEDVFGIERYLASGIVKGIGEVLAKRIVKKFKGDTLRIMEEEPERLAEISGISEKKAQRIATSFMEKKEFRDVLIFLSGYGVSVNTAMKIYNTYGDKVYSIVKENPYKLAEDITGIGFKVADSIAIKSGIREDSEFRVRSATVYALSTAHNEGHMYLPEDSLIRTTYGYLRGVDYDRDAEYGYAEYESAESGMSVYEQYSELIHEQIMELTLQGKLMLKQVDGVPCVYLASSYYVELNTARMLCDLQLKYEVPEAEIDADIKKIHDKDGLTLDEIQIKAVKAAINAGVCVITGGPGTGKTTIIDTIIRFFVSRGMEIKLCAPTGRAAKRMNEQTGWPAQTIHRLLEFSGSPDEDRNGVNFGRNAETPLECDAVIVDEMSMADSFLFYSLLCAITYGTRLILVGDINQLPSVGPGNVLRDIIASSCFPVTVLDTIYRQADGSDIVFNAHKINKGEHLVMDNKSKDFFFLNRPTPAKAIEEVEVLISDNLPKYLKLKPTDIEVLCPMRRHDTGVENMNRRLQKLLNPHAPGKNEYVKNDVVFRVGDKVMQIKNNYKKEWRLFGVSTGGGKGMEIDEGIGVFNGDMGMIIDISDFDEEITVLFDDGREAAYAFSEADELEHSFAITIHKSQGSEYPAVIIPLMSGSKKFMSRNLLYTAITRAKRFVVIVGNIAMVNQMIDNADEIKRYTSLALRIEEMYDALNG